MKTALVTGSTGGIGAAVAEKLAEQGYRLILTDVAEERLNQQAENYADCDAHIVDMNDQQAVRALCSRMQEERWKIDVAFINAGVIVVGNLTELTPEQMDVQLQVNLVASAHLIHTIAKLMAARKSGHIITTVSMGGIVSLKGSATYSASKFGLRGLLWGLRDELSAQNVHVTGIYPAGVDTPMLRHEAHNGGSPLNFVGTPVTVDDISKAVLRAITKPKLEIYVPYSESISGRFASAFPGFLSKTYPFFEWLGERGRQSFLRRIGEDSSSGSTIDTMDVSVAAPRG